MKQKQYKLIKTYPGSPELGYIWTMYVGYKGDYHKQPEFWEEVVEKDYEILSFIGNITNKIILNKDSQLKDCFCKIDGRRPFLQLEHLLQDNMFNIHSVKRLSDGEIFTVGDKTNCGNINQIQWDDIKGLWLDFDGHGGYSTYKSLQKIKTPLFKTEDGVGIFEGDYSYGVHNSKFDIVKIKHISTVYVGDNFIEFSTKEKAEEYILMNKPCLSLKEIENYSNITLGGLKSLKELVKTKLK